MARKIHENPNNCPVTKTIGYIGGKWKPIILFLLMDGSMRFGKLTLFLPSISRKILTQQLKELEEDGLILRHSFSEKPPRVEYELSERGQTIIPVLKSMCAWGEMVGKEDLALADQ